MNAQDHGYTDKPERDATLLQPQQAHIEGPEKDKGMNGGSLRTHFDAIDSFSNASDIERDAGISRFPTQRDGCWF